MKRVALYFGSFNPLHYGHLGIAEYIILNFCIDRFEMILSPHNPFKDRNILLHPQTRLASLKKAIRLFNKDLSIKIKERNALLSAPAMHNSLRLYHPARNSKVWKRGALIASRILCNKVTINDIEFNLPEPLYTYNTIKELQKRNPDTEYILVVGADSIKSMPNWYRGEELLKEFSVIVYPRSGYRVKTLCRKYKATYLGEAPLNNISSTQIRNGQV